VGNKGEYVCFEFLAICLYVLVDLTLNFLLSCRLNSTEVTKNALKWGQVSTLTSHIPISIPSPTQITNTKHSTHLSLAKINAQVSYHSSKKKQNK